MKRLGRIILNKKELVNNLHKVELYLLGKEGEECRQEMIKLIGKGTNFVAYKIDGYMHFAPSRFIGYLNNSLCVHLLKNNGKDGTKTSPAIDKILCSKRKYDKDLDSSFLEYCDIIGAKPKNMFKAKRTFWYIDEPEIKTFTLYEEGKSEQVSTNRYERNKEAREKCIAYHGCKCKVCDIDFETVYGDVGRGFIHVHHIVPISTIGISKVNPIKDLIPVCPNCHAMLHRGFDGKTLTVEELKVIMKK